MLDDIIINNLNEITGITADSREVTPGYIFVAIKGGQQDGHNYIEKAINNGAKTIIYQDEIKQKPGITYIKVKNARLALSKASAMIYPRQPKYILGVTGTCGKSSTVHFVREILRLLEQKAVSIGTMGILGDLEMSSDLNTPPANKLHQILQTIHDNNINYVAMECSSHGIDQDRLTSVSLSACGFTNFSQDHLDYHHTMAEYFAAKRRVFSLMKAGYVALNSDIAEIDDLLEACKKHKIICYGKNPRKEAKHNVVISSIKEQELMQNVKWQIDGESYESEINLVGEFQIYNLSCAIGLLMSAGITLKQIMPLLSLLSTVTGRMELVSNYNGAAIFVDYAHKPDALLNVLSTLRKSTKNNLWVVFGCGGNRDFEKRKIMGEIASDHADKVIITDDNPRSEDPSSIRKEILKGCNHKTVEIADREEAIIFALERLLPGDNLLIAGKGHENYQIKAEETIEFSDVDIVKSWLTIPYIIEKLS
jgi:UDP-N-acetylmuramoyl-L-alanyl-D-glutamate--2,6-diaminopimelate ligase